MVKNIFSSLFAVFLFALGAAGSWYFVQWQEEQRAKKEAEAEVPADAQKTSATETELTSTHESHDAHAKEEKHEKAAEPLPIPVRPGAMTAEQIVRTASQYRQQVEKLKQREEYVETQESRLKLTEQDLNQRKQEIDGMLKQVQGYVEQGEKILAAVQSERQLLQAEKESRDKEMQQIKDARSVPNESLEENLKKSAQYIAGLADENAAAVIKQWVNDGKTDYALEVLERVQERNASKIMGALGAQDQALVSELLLALKDMKRETTATKKR